MPAPAFKVGDKVILDSKKVQENIFEVIQVDGLRIKIQNKDCKCYWTNGPTRPGVWTASSDLKLYVPKKEETSTNPFRFGDKVAFNTDVYARDVYEVTGIDGDSITIKGLADLWKADRFYLVEGKKKETSTNPFKVGDKVKHIRDLSNPNPRVYRVREIDGDLISLYNCGTGTGRFPSYANAYCLVESKKEEDKKEAAEDAGLVYLRDYITKCYADNKEISLTKEILFALDMLKTVYGVEVQIENVKKVNFVKK